MADYLEVVCAQSLEQMSNGRHADFARAMQMSTRIDTDYFDLHQRKFPDGNRNVEPVKERGRIKRPKIHTIQEIQKANGFDTKDVEDFGIALGRPEAFKFLSGITSIKWSVFQKLYTISSYEQKFGITPFDVGRNRLLLTYADWVHFVGVTHPPALPESVRQLNVRRGAT